MAEAGRERDRHEPAPRPALGPRERATLAETAYTVLRKKLLFTLGIIALFRLGSVVPTPGVDYQAIQRCIDTVQIDVRRTDAAFRTNWVALAMRDDGQDGDAGAGDGVFTVRLTGKDDLATDNEASIVSLLPKPVNVLLVTRGNRLLEKALRAVANVNLAVANDLTDAAAARTAGLDG